MTANLSTPNKPSSNLIIIGGGMVCHYFLHQAVRLGIHKTHLITVFSEENLPPYDRIHLTEAYASLEAETLLLSPEKWYLDHGIRLYTSTRVLGIDLAKKTLRTDTRGSQSYDQVIFATGSRPHVPPLEGTHLPKIHYYRNFNDLKEIKNSAKLGHSAVVIGGGLLGLEAARALNEDGCQVKLIEYADYLLPRQLQPESAALLKKLIEETGIEIITRCHTQKIAQEKAKLSIYFKNQASVTTDMIVIATGVMPRDELAHINGLKVDLGGGIEIDSHARTSDPNIFAMGDCISFEGQRIGLAAPGFRMAEIIAKQIAKVDFQPYVSTNSDTSLKFAGVEVSVIGDYRRPNSERYIWQEENHYRLLVCTGQQIIGLVHVGTWTEVPQIQEIIKSKTHISESDLQSFSKSGLLLENSESTPDLNHPDTIICNCMQITKGTIDACIQSGCTSLPEIGTRTGAGMICGSCKPTIAHLANLETEAPADNKSLTLTFLSASILTLLIFCLFFVPSLSASTSVQGRFYPYEYWWTESFFQQISGYTAAGFMVLGLLLSLRKRFRFFAKGNFAVWRWAHALLSGLSLVFYFFHSGNHLGHGINFLLVLNFLLMQTSGCIAGIHIGLFGDLLSSSQRKLRNKLIQIHLLLFTLLPALLAFHLSLSYLY